MGEPTTRRSMVQWLPWCCLMSALPHGRGCVDNPNAVDQRGDGCSWYGENPGGCGQYDTATFAAARDCCASCNTCDTTGEMDTGGDNCSFYDERPEFCGCCNTPSFIAERDCCACGRILQGTAAWWMDVLRAWPRKAVSLHLEGKGLHGDIPPTLGLLVNLKSLGLKENRLTGNVPPELGDLSDLERIDLSSNQLSGSLPAELGRLSQLQHLILHSNNLNGSLPAELGNLSELRHLHLHNNNLNGSLPAELGNLSQLQQLFLYNNSLSGSLPAELGKLSQLQWLYLRSNQLSGSLPAELGKLSRLQYLVLYGNQLSGNVPPELGRLSELQFLQLYDNLLSGSLPVELGELSQLLDLRLQENQLSGSLPAELGKLSRLLVLGLNSNQLSGSLPAELGNLSELLVLALSSNQLNGSLPAELGNLSRLQGLSLHNNQLSGRLPAELGNLSHLQSLQLYANRLSGRIPAELGQLSQLRHLILKNNELSGSLPAELWKLSQLEWLDLDDNQLSGSLPAELGNLSKLQRLTLAGNQISGWLPTELGNLSQLQRLRLSGNQLSGSLPVELGKLSQLQWLVLNENQLSGSLPAELGKLLQLEHLVLHSNNLSGSLPAELGNLARLQALYLHSNQLEGGIPTSYRNMSLLQFFVLNRNPHFCGSTDAITQLRQLRVLDLRGCCFQTIAPPPAGLEFLDLGENRLTAVPESIRVLPSVKTLMLDHNRIRHWDTSSIVPLSWYTGGVCGYRPRSPRPAWPSLVQLDVSANLFGPLVHDFLATLVHLEHLRVLLARDNRLSGGMPVIGAGFMSNLEHAGNGDCTDFPAEGPVFPALVTLDLSRNRITHMHSSPPTLLVEMDLAGNQLTAAGLSHSWWRGTISFAAKRALQLVSVQGNPALRLPIQLAPDSSCEDSEAELAANAQGWVPAAAAVAADSECTSLCRRQPRVLLDVSAREEVLCRCSAGQGTGLNCTACPDDAYSVQSFDRSKGHYMRECHWCPMHSQLRGSVGLCFADCSCDAGYFMQQTVEGGSATDLGSRTCSLLQAELHVATAQLKGQREIDLEGRCRPCGIWRTSKAGSRTEADCLCNGNRSNGGWSGLFQEGSKCRCPDRERIDFQRRSCVRCDVAEDCVDWTRSLEPPRVKAGFWALPPPPAGSDGTYGNFSGHSIWRCDSQEACPGSFTCGLNRTGTACSLCQQGFFRTPGGGCLRCPRSYVATRFLLLGLLLSSTVFPLLAHGLLTVVDDSSRGQVMALRSFRISLKQLLKFAQILGVVSLFQVEWPDLVVSVFQVFRAFSLDFASWAGVACLSAQQQETVALELTFRWMLPVLAATVTSISAAAARTCGVLCLRRRETSLGRLLNFRFFDVLRVLLFFLQLFYPSVVKNALLPLTCSPSPNSYLTMNRYPHTVCFNLERGASFWPLALLGGVYTVLLIAGYPLLLFRLRRRLPEPAGEAEIAPASWWAFVFDDFRPDCRLFVLVVVGKDILLNLIPAVLPGLGTFQLLITAMVSCGYAFCLHLSVPFHNTSNTLLEVCTSAAVAILCVFSAGMGFQSEPEVLDISAYLEDGRSNPVYLQRALTLVCLQTLSLFAPAAIITFQVLAAFERTRRFFPRALLPASDQQLHAWRQDTYATLDQLDDVALASVHRWVKSSAAAQRSLRRASLTQDGPEPESTNVEQPGSVAQDGPEGTNMEQTGEEPLQPSQPADGPQAAVLGRVSL